MICSGCGNLVEEDRNLCPYCGAPATPLPSYTRESSEFNPYKSLLERKLQSQIRRNRTIGIILIVIGIIFLPIAILTLNEFFGWIFLSIMVICFLAGIVTVATNLSKKTTLAYS